MIISLNTYYIFCGLVVLFSLSPILYGKLTKRGDKYGWTWIFILFLIPINWFTPAVYDVQDCGDYTKQILIAPKDGFSMGRHNYVINNSKHDLLFESIVYGRVDKDDIKKDIIIKGGTSSLVPVISIDYLFEASPASVKMKGDGQVNYRLSCDKPYSNEEGES